MSCYVQAMLQIFWWEFSFNEKIGLEMASSCCGHQSKLLKADKQTRGLGFSGFSFPFHNSKQRWVADDECKRPTLRIGSAGFMYVITRNLVLSKHRWQKSCLVQTYAPGPHINGHICGRVWPLARLQVLQNSGSRMFMLGVKTLSERDRHWRNPRK